MVNLTSGVPVKQGIASNTIDYPAFFRDLKDRSFDGYICLAVQGAESLEEGTLVYDNGKPVAVLYEYFKWNKLLQGEPAFPRFMNATAAEIGVVDIYGLKNEEVQLLLAFYERAIYLPAEKDLSAIPTRFDEKFEKEIAEAAPQSKEDILKRYKLADVRVGEYKTETAEPEPEIPDALQKLLEQKKTKK